MYREDLVKQWLWMQAMAYALENIARGCKNKAVPSEDDRRYKPWYETLRKTYEYVLANWDDAVYDLSDYQGAYSSHSRYDLGYEITIDNKKINAEYRTTKVTITFAEVKSFIERMLQPPEMAERQMTMFDMLAEQAPQNL